MRARACARTFQGLSSCMYASERVSIRVCLRARPFSLSSPLSFPSPPPLPSSLARSLPHLRPARYTFIRHLPRPNTPATTPTAPSPPFPSLTGAAPPPPALSAPSPFRGARGQPAPRILRHREHVPLPPSPPVRSPQATALALAGRGRGPIPYPSAAAGRKRPVPPPPGHARAHPPSRDVASARGPPGRRRAPAGLGRAGSQSPAAPPASAARRRGRRSGRLPRPRHPPHAAPVPRLRPQ